MGGKENANPPDGSTVETPAVVAQAPAPAAPVTTTPPADKQEDSWAKKLGKGNARELLQEGLAAKATNVEVEDAPADGEEEGQPPAAAAGAAPKTEPVETPDAKIARLEKELQDKTEAEAKKAQKEEQDRQQTEARTLDQKQHNELTGRLNIINGQRALVSELEQEAEEAADEFGVGTSQHSKVLNRLQLAKYTLGGQVHDYNSVLAGFQNNYASKQFAEATQSINSALAEHGVTIEDIKAANPKADLTNVYSIMKEAVKVATSKQAASQKAELDKEKAAIAKELEELKAERTKWGRSPGAQPDRGIAGAGGGGAGGQDILAQIRSGKSSTELISTGLKVRKK